MKQLALLFVMATMCVEAHPNRAIRKFNIKKFLTIEHSLEDCGGSNRPGLGIEYIKYADVDGDGKEEALVVASTCWSGTGGPDIQEVLKLSDNGTLINVSPSDMIREFKGKPIFPETGNWIVDLDFSGGCLIKSYLDSHGASGVVTLYFKWRKGRFELMKVETKAN